jgi:hypothetical protein
MFGYLKKGGEEMKKFVAVFFLAALALQGCSDKTRDDLKIAGKDMQKDVKDAADDVRNKIHEATD